MSEPPAMNVAAAAETATSRQCELHGEHLEALYAVSQVLSRSLEYRHALREVLTILDDAAALGRGMVSVIDAASGALMVHVVHDGAGVDYKPVRYQAGEGLLGLVLEENRSVVSSAIGEDERFLNRLGIYDPALPFIAAPIKVAGAIKGVLAVQPRQTERAMLPQRSRFVEMIANLIGGSVDRALRVAAETDSLLEERDRLRRTVRNQFGFNNIVGHSPAMRRIFEQMRLVARWNTTVLIRGETGSGKELVANAIHYNSPRTRGPYVKLNCAALPENLLESELFGHEKGAFTGAIGARKGRFEQADGGTLFLDEIGDISPAFQAKLLRVLQEGEFERVGGGRSLKVDVRIIAATHRDLEAAVEAGDFREDLFYRLSVMPLTLPPLRERLEDIPDIARHLLQKIGKAQNRKLVIHEAAMRRLASHSWPGNVRELENCLERAAILTEEGVIDAGLIRFVQKRDSPPARPSLSATSPSPQQGDTDSSENIAADVPLDERSRVIAALEQAGWVQARAARLLGITPRQIAYRIQTLNIEVKQL